MIGFRYMLRPTHDAHPMLRAYRSVGMGSPLPDVVDLRMYARPVRDQLQEGSCSGFAWAGARAAIHGHTVGQPLAFDLSPAFVYFYERMIEGRIDEDSGASLGDGAHVAQNRGICPEQDMPYVAGDFTRPPLPLADCAANDWKLGAVFPVQRDLELLKRALVANPVVFGIQVYQSFEQPDAEGNIAVPNPDAEGFLGGHALLALGYDNARAAFLVRNQWGVAWGDHGDCWIPFAFLPFLIEAWTGAE